ncbi:hypothetical protein DNTS_027644 [Danionella cerebrum]|uniref:Uncharacterized protein n=1 Tax=Danionella cerebrum TaxID=2873325 RepID=A0A553MXC3_9TELE|nr:hypothetical protein DNTS_027644 [Danionella translucida]
METWEEMDLQLCSLERRTRGVSLRADLQSHLSPLTDASCRGNGGFSLEQHESQIPNSTVLETHGVLCVELVQPRQTTTT